MTRAVIAAVVTVALALATPARATTLVPLPTHGRIELAYEPGLDKTARELADDAERELARIAADLPDLPVPATVRVQLVRDASSLPQIAPGAPPWAIGLASGATVSIALRRGGQVESAFSTLRHELAHVALTAALGDRAPRWLHEGFAYQHSGEWSWERTETLAGMAWFGGIVPLGELDRSFPAEEAPANRAYAESYDFVGFLARRGRWDDGSDAGDRWPFRQFLRALGRGEAMDRAATAAFGRPLRALFDEWRESLSKRYLFAPIGLLGLALWILCAMLLAIAFWRRRRANRARLAQWDRDERAADDLARIAAPPYVPWPGEDPFADEDDDLTNEPKPVN